MAATRNTIKPTKNAMTTTTTTTGDNTTSLRPFALRALCRALGAIAVQSWGAIGQRGPTWECCSQRGDSVCGKGGVAATTRTHQTDCTAYVVPRIMLDHTVWSRDGQPSSTHVCTQPLGKPCAMKKNINHHNTNNRKQNTHHYHQNHQQHHQQHSPHPKLGYSSRFAYPHRPIQRRCPDELP